MVKVLLKLFLLFVFCSVSLEVNAQVLDVQLQTFTDEAVSHTFLSRNQPAVSLPASNGDITLDTTGVPFEYRFTYTPDLGFEGTDEVRLLYFPLELPNSFALLRYSITVEPLILKANHDIASTFQGAAVSIPVLDNDESSTGILNLISAPAVNGGTVEVIGDEIIFTPEAGFTGLTDFNYVVCALADGYDYCKTGTVSVNVLSNFGVAAVDSTQVFTKKFSVYGTGAMMLVPENYTLQTPPVNGVYDIEGSIPIYRPLPGHVGIEYLTYSNGADDIVYIVETLDLVSNDFTVADRAYTSQDRPVTINVVQNDLFGAFSGCLSFDPPSFGSLEIGATTGQVIYTPPVGWSGVDRFTYTSFPPGCPPGSVGETETVTVVISDFRPASSSFSLTTASNAILPFTYQGPNDNISWSVEVPPTLGTINVDQTTGQLNYIPNADVVGVDFTTVRWCLEDADGFCLSIELVEVSINIIAPGDGVANCTEGDDCVWPGDTNQDGIVDVSDLLPIGYYMGSAGTPRTSIAPGSWAPQEADDWNEFDNGVNRKHVDANGDQFITSLDTQVVVDNLGMVSRIRPDVLPVADYDVILEGDIFAEPGDIIELEVLLGTNYIGVEDIAGFTFPFNYDTSYVDPGSVSFLFDNKSWLSYDSPIITLSTNDTEEGLLEFAMARTSGIPTSGYGQIARLYIGVEDIAGFLTDPGQTTTTVIGGGMAESLSGAGHRSAVNVQPLELTIINPELPSQPAIDQTIDAFLDDKTLTYPNPTANQLTIHLNGQREFTGLTMTDLTGRTVEQYTGEPANHKVLDLSAYPIGIYTLQITTTEGVVTRKIEVIR